MSDTLTLHNQKIRRITASDASAWVAANAGSGKTHVLTLRVIRLLLSGVDPSRILCLTYTKAAAAEMAARVFDRLKIWVSAPDDELAADLEGLMDVPPKQADIQRARQSFATALETPGGLKIQTLHAFCERVLQQFPFEAPVPTGFELLDDTAAEALWGNAFNAVYRQALHAGSETQQNFYTVQRALGSDFEPQIRSLLSRRGALQQFIRSMPNEAAMDAAIRGAIGLVQDQNPHSFELQLQETGLLDPQFVGAMCEALKCGGSQDLDRIEILQRTQKAVDAKASYSTLLELIETSKGELSKKVSVGKSVKLKYPELDEKYNLALQKLTTLREEKLKQDAYDISRASLNLSIAVLKRFQAQKAAQRVLDFEDLILKTRDLLTRADTAFVHFKLDGGIDHILVDEAQDTSPEQWEIISELASEFFVGEGTHKAIRTLFVVGDEKQSIYRFQGAAPEKFAQMRREFSYKAQGANALWHDGHQSQLNISFRSTQDVLNTVDAVFAAPEMAQQLTSDDRGVVHETNRRNAYGCVDIYPLPPVDAKAELESLWGKYTQNPLSHNGRGCPNEMRAGEGETINRIMSCPHPSLATLVPPSPIMGEGNSSPTQTMIAQIISAIQDLLNQPHVVDDHGKPRRIVPGDILILVRKRKLIFESLLKALRDANIPVAGADRLDLSAHIAVQDLLALVDVVHMPEDDLQLACVLKSPLFSWSEEDLLAIAPERKGTLWQEIQATPAAAALKSLQRMAADMRPYEFFAHVLGAMGGRQKFAIRLGADVHEILDEFLNVVLSYETANVPSLTGFARWMRNTQHILKREMAEAGNAVRILTVHNAKGLEAPVVILAETCSELSRQKKPRILNVEYQGMSIPLLSQDKASAPDVVQNAREQLIAEDSAEDMRLLYVAMTRARDRLLVFGAVNKEKAESKQKDDQPKPLTWYEAIQAGLKNWQGSVEECGQFTRYRVTDSALLNDTIVLNAEESTPPKLEDQIIQLQPLDLPVFNSVRAVAGGITKNLPSPIIEEGAPAKHGAGEGETFNIKSPQLRGIIIHKLLELRASEEHMHALIQQMDPSGEAGGGMVEEVQGILNHPELQEMWQGALYPELPLMGSVMMEGEVHHLTGRIDLLAKIGTRYVIVDFKTDSHFSAEVEPAYRMQLHLYAQLLRGSLGADAEITACIVGTRTGQVMWV